MNEVNQLVLDCMAKVLRINQTTNAQITFEHNHCSAVCCYGWEHGYGTASKDQRTDSPVPDFHPLSVRPMGAYSEVIYLRDYGATDKLRALLASLNNLEKELLSDAG